MTRALPSIYDGLKLVHRRIIYVANKLPEKLVKTANVAGSCLTGDTLVVLEDFSRVRIDELDNYKNKKILSYDDKLKRFTKCEWTNLRVTKETAELVELELDNGSTIRCTPDHKFLVKGSNKGKGLRKYVEANDLLGRSLVPANIVGTVIKSGDLLQNVINSADYYGYIYLVINKVNGKIYVGQHHGEFDASYLGSGTLIRRAVNKYGSVNFSVEILDVAYSQDELNSKETYWIKTYADTNASMYNIMMVGEYPHQLKLDRHHYYDPTTDTEMLLPDNSDLLKGDHSLIKGRRRNYRSVPKGTSKLYTDGKTTIRVLDGDKVPVGFRRGKVSCSSNTKLLKSIITSNYWSSLSEDYRLARLAPWTNTHTSNFNQSSRIKGFRTRIIKYINNLIVHEGTFNQSIYEASLESSGGHRMMPSYERLLNYFNSYDELVDLATNYNHKVIRVTSLSLDTPVKVYDISVPGTHNFVLDSGVITHNCMAYHPHGDCSGSIASLGYPLNRVPLLTTKGNWGGPGFCFTGDTKVSLLDGRELPIKDIVSEYNSDNQDLWVYACTPEGMVLPRRIINVFDNGVKSLVEVKLDNDEVIRCTPDHQFMLRDGSYKPAKDLNRDDNLMVRDQVRVISVTALDYSENVYDIEVDEYHNFALSSGVFVHNCGASSRYTEFYLSSLARYIYCQFVDYTNYIDGELEHQEPESLPCLLPYALLEGYEGMGIGLATKILPLNVLDLIDYYLDVITKGKSDRLVRPDLGDVVINMTKDEVIDSVSGYSSKISVYSLVTQESADTMVVSGLGNRVTLSRVLTRLDDLLESDRVLFRDESTTKERYVFEIVDKTILPSELKRRLEKATVSNDTFKRVMTDGVGAYYCSLEYVVAKSLESLNKAIDAKLSHDISELEKALLIANSMELAKSKGVFNGVDRITKEELITRLTDIGISESVANDIGKKNIFSLTKSRDDEIEKYKSKLAELNSHDRTKFLVEMYEHVRELIRPIYNSKGHSVMIDDLLTDPKVILRDRSYIEVGKPRNGYKFDNYVYPVASDGIVYRLTVSSSVKTDIDLTKYSNEFVGLTTDKYPYLVLKFKKNNYIYALGVDCTQYKYDKCVWNSSDGATLVSAEGFKDKPSYFDSIAKSKISKAVYVEELNS